MAGSWKVAAAAWRPSCPGRPRSWERTPPGRNTDGIGIENEGTYIKELPPAALQYSLLLLCAFICRQYGLGSNSIIGHRNINATQCPGEKFYQDLDNLRTAVAVMI